MDFDEKVVASRELRSGVNTEVTDVRVDRLINVKNIAFKGGDTTTEFDFEADNITENPDNVELAGSINANVLGKSDLLNLEDNLIYGIRYDNFAQLESGEYIHINRRSSEECIVIEADTPYIQQPIILSESRLDDELGVVADKLRNSNDLSIQLTEGNNPQITIERETESKDPYDRLFSAIGVSNAIMMAVLIPFLPNLFTQFIAVGFMLFSIYFAEDKLLDDTVKVETTSYNATILDDRTVLQGDVDEADRQKYQTVTIQVDTSGKQDKLVADEIDAEWTLTSDFYDSDLIELFESIGLEKIDQDEVHVTVSRSNIPGKTEGVESDSGEWVIPTDQSYTVEKNKELSQSYN